MKIYKLKYQKSNIISFKYFSNKKQLNRFIKLLPKSLIDFEVTRQGDNTINWLTNDYLKSEKHEYILK